MIAKRRRPKRLIAATKPRSEHSKPHLTRPLLLSNAEPCRPYLNLKRFYRLSNYLTPYLKPLQRTTRIHKIIKAFKKYQPFFNFVFTLNP